MRNEEAAARAAVRDLIAGRAAGPVRLPLLSGSMAGALLPGDVLLVRPASGRSVHAGDVAVFVAGGALTAHRVVFALRLGGAALLLEMGDANRLASRLPQAAVVGVVREFERGGALLRLERGAAARRTAARLLFRWLACELPRSLARSALGKHG